mmetsp:Transcript_1043/g.2184  ORF Transcript_1043/g.2184 Transcript_1043/m.2184 type:complete len:221 (-) Transcript_1043:336-998(-)
MGIPRRANSESISVDSPPLLLFVRSASLLLVLLIGVCRPALLSPADLFLGVTRNAPGPLPLEGLFGAPLVVSRSFSTTPPLSSASTSSSARSSCWSSAQSPRTRRSSPASREIMGVDCSSSPRAAGTGTSCFWGGFSSLEDGFASSSVVAMLVPALSAPSFAVVAFAVAAAVVSSRSFPLVDDETLMVLLFSAWPLVLSLEAASEVVVLVATEVLVSASV